MEPKKLKNISTQLFVIAITHRRYKVFATRLEKLKVQYLPPESPLKTLLTSRACTPQLKLFLRWIRKFNSYFQMVTFETTKIFTQNPNDGFNFGWRFIKIKSQMYYQICFLILIPDADIKILASSYTSSWVSRSNK